MKPKKNTSTTKTQVTNQLHRVEAVAERLGLAVPTTRRLIWAGKLRGKKIGRAVLVSESALVDFIEQLPDAHC